MFVFVIFKDLILKFIWFVVGFGNVFFINCLLMLFIVFIDIDKIMGIVLLFVLINWGGKLFKFKRIIFVRFVVLIFCFVVNWRVKIDFKFLGDRLIGVKVLLY